MAQKLFAPELFRPPLDLPPIPYDHLLRLSAERTPERPAIIFHDLTLTYREVVSMVNCVANGLRALGIGKGDRICLFTPNRPEYTITLNAAATLGAVVTPVNDLRSETGGLPFGLHLDSTSTQRPFAGALLWLRCPTHQGWLTNIPS